jgi:hypothetical protein
MRISVHIERVILEGLPVARAHGPLLQAAVERELADLLAAGGLARELTVGGAVVRVSGGPLRLAQGSDPRRLGKQIARSVYEGIGR